MNPWQSIVAVLSKRIHRLEYDPVTQFKFHFFFTWFWFLAMLTLPWIRPLYTHNIGVLLIEEISLWANFVSHMTALGAAIAGMFASGSYVKIPGLQKLFEEIKPRNRRVYAEEVGLDPSINKLPRLSAKPTPPEAQF